jgi:quinol monooxygenase YgiN
VSEIQGIGRIKLHEGKLEEFKRLGARIIEIVRTKDTGTLQFEIFFNDNQTECIILERYKDYGAFMEHSVHLGDVTAAIPTLGSMTGACLSESSKELKAALAGSGVELFTPHLSL